MKCNERMRGRDSSKKLCAILNKLIEKRPDQAAKLFIQAVKYDQQNVLADLEVAKKKEKSAFAAHKILFSEIIP